MRWLLVFLIACVLFNGLHTWLSRLGLGRLPGDFRFRFGGRDWFLPVTSSLLLSLLASAVGMLI